MRLATWLGVRPPDVEQVLPGNGRFTVASRTSPWASLLRNLSRGGAGNGWLIEEPVFLLLRGHEARPQAPASIPNGLGTTIAALRSVRGS
jgi:hypothetical protein